MLQCQGPRRCRVTADTVVRLAVDIVQKQVIDEDNKAPYQPRNLTFSPTAFEGKSARRQS